MPIFVKIFHASQGEDADSYVQQKACEVSSLEEGRRFAFADEQCAKFKIFEAQAPHPNLHRKILEFAYVGEVVPFSQLPLKSRERQNIADTMSDVSTLRYYTHVIYERSSQSPSYAGPMHKDMKVYSPEGESLWPPTRQQFEQEFNAAVTEKRFDKPVFEPG